MFAKMYLNYNIKFKKSQIKQINIAEEVFLLLFGLFGVIIDFRRGGIIF
jgi:hypothetical protein